PYAIGVVNEGYEDNEIPFGISREESIEFATRQFQIRMNVLERARGKSVDEIYAISEETVGVVS
ncbi:MAG: ribonucleotide-diphosphate reductase, partial [Alicyclobacillaceae bacterium]|nr:ribonucleotide-diphosphate reductase [Alicyclobacillaceae bacterium]